jgi:hypothetical protein
MPVDLYAVSSNHDNGLVMYPKFWRVCLYISPVATVAISPRFTGSLTKQQAGRSFKVNFETQNMLQV